MEENNDIDLTEGSTGTELIPQGSSELITETEKAGTELVKKEKEYSDVIDEADAEFIKKEDEEIRKKNELREEAANANPSEEFADELAEIEHEAEDNELIKNLGDSINKQVEMEIGELVPEENAQDSSNGEESEKPERKGFIGFLCKVPKWIYITLGIVLFVVLLVVVLDASGLGEKILIKLGAKVSSELVDYQPIDPENTEIKPDLVESLEGFEEVLTPIPTEEVTPTPEPTPEPVEYEKKIINILLLGEENIGSYSTRGRTDMIVLATIDTITKTVKLTSLMRDSFVQIPGFEDNRINAAYALGGVPLLYSTIEKNFGITPDNYILVRFDDFEKMVDSVGGIDIELSKKEAQYLNKTNYISNPVFRNVVEGMNHMNGNQALGYSRVRYVAHDGEKNDFGRTTRHRVVITALINRVKSLGYTDLLNVGLECLPMVTTDVTAEEIEKYTQMIIDIGGADINIEEMRIPMEGTYNFVTIRKMSVTQLDIQKNREALHEFIYGNSGEDNENPETIPEQ